MSSFFQRELISLASSDLALIEVSYFAANLKACFSISEDWIAAEQDSSQQLVPFWQLEYSNDYLCIFCTDYFKEAAYRLQYSLAISQVSGIHASV